MKTYKDFAAQKFLQVDEQDCLNAFKKHLLEMKPPLAPNTMQSKFNHIRKWLKEAYGKNFHTSWFKGT